jgi:hypothetical protein
MIKTIVLFGAALERAMQDVYSEIAATCPEASVARKMLRALSSEEEHHASMLRKILPDLPDTHEPNATLLTVLRRQGVTLDRVHRLRDAVGTPEFDLAAALDELAVIERTLPENLFEHLRRYLPEAAVPAVQRLADADGRHESLLERAREDVAAVTSHDPG